MKLIVPERKDLYRMLLFVVAALMVVFYLTPKISSAADLPASAAPASVEQTSTVSGTTAPIGSAKTEKSDGYNPPDMATPPENTPPPTTPGENP